jgi:hypothetical protein
MAMAQPRLAGQWKRRASPETTVMISREARLKYFLPAGKPYAVVLQINPIAV